jgi:hypothetical protein
MKQQQQQQHRSAPLPFQLARTAQPKQQKDGQQRASKGVLRRGPWPTKLPLDLAHRLHK